MDLKIWEYRGVKIYPCKKAGFNWECRLFGGVLRFKTKKSVKRNLNNISFRE